MNPPSCFDKPYCHIKIATFSGMTDILANPIKLSEIKAAPELYERNKQVCDNCLQQGR